MNRRADISVSGAARLSRCSVGRALTGGAGWSVIRLLVQSVLVMALTCVGLAVPAAAAPVISSISDQSITEDTSTSAIAFSITGFTSRAPTLSGSSSNPDLVASSGLSFGGTGGARMVTVTPVANQAGTATITVTVNDPAGTDTETFVVTVIAVNDPPTISDLGDQSVSGDQTLGP